MYFATSLSTCQKICILRFRWAHVRRYVLKDSVGHMSKGMYFFFGHMSEGRDFENSLGTVGFMRLPWAHVRRCAF